MLLSNRRLSKFHEFIRILPTSKFATSHSRRVSIMGKRKSTHVVAKEKEDKGNVCESHVFSDEETRELQESLISWYDKNKRDLPWRNLEDDDVNKKAYGVWVSEIMLQQTQVATVIDYYNKWMKRWPTVEDLAKSTLEEVNEIWSGLGYYSRGRRLREAAIKVVEEMKGKIPDTADSLMKDLPGVGKYTSGAIASIAFKQVTGVVDGNVIRVFTRMRSIGADVTSSFTDDAIWGLANGSVDSERPGDYNQSLMELGATVCTPKSPDCTNCPVQNLCLAYKRVEQEKKKSAAKFTQNKSASNNTEVTDIEDAVGQCRLCLPEEEPWDTSVGVMNYPRKGKKKAPREERTCVCVIQTVAPDPEYLITQRPETGLLANLWEFPSAPVETDTPDTENWPVLHQHLSETFLLTKDKTENKKFVDEVVHIFSHIHQTYIVHSCCVRDKEDVSLENSPRAAKWVTRSEFMESAISTAMKKVFKAVEKQGPKKQKTKNVKTPQSDGKKQLGMMSFFKPVSAK